MCPNHEAESGRERGKITSARFLSQYGGIRGVENFPSFWILIMAGILRLGDIGASKYYLSAWAIGKVCCPNVGCKSRELFEPNDLDQHYRIIHPKCSFDGKIIEGKKSGSCWLKKRLEI